MKSFIEYFLVISCALLATTSNVQSEIPPSFPGAMGFVAIATCGRGSDEFKVTSVNVSRAGSNNMQYACNYFNVSDCRDYRVDTKAYLSHHD